MSAQVKHNNTVVKWIASRRFGPIGIDLGSRAIQLVQFTADRKKLIDVVRWDLPGMNSELSPEVRGTLLAEAVQQARHGRGFKGNDAVVCLSAPDLFVQNIRVPKESATELNKVIQQEAATRLPYPVAEAEIRYLCVGDVRQGEQIKREIILFACHRPVRDRLLATVHRAGLRATAVDVEPAALLRSYVQQFRRDIDKDQRAMYVRMGQATSTVVIAQGMHACFIKFIDVGEGQMDDAVARHLKISLDEAVALRRHNGDRRVDQQNPEIARSLQEATRPVVQRLVNELALCIRYHRVAFHGQSLARLIVGGREAVPALVDRLGSGLDVKCELGDPLRAYESPLRASRLGEWDVAAGLALRDLN